MVLFCDMSNLLSVLQTPHSAAGLDNGGQGAWEVISSHGCSSESARYISFATVLKVKGMSRKSRLQEPTF